MFPYMQSRYWPTSKALLLAYFLIPGITLEERLVVHGYAELSITADHALPLASLPLLHKALFGRLLPAQTTSFSGFSAKEAATASARRAPHRLFGGNRQLCGKRWLLSSSYFRNCSSNDISWAPCVMAVAIIIRSAGSR